MTDVLIAGVGGQGSVIAARMLGDAAMAAGLDLRGSETIGMAQRGGSVVSHVRMGHDIASPLIEEGGADVVIALEPGEAARALPYLKPDGVMIACDRPVIPAVAGGYDPARTLAWLRESVRSLHIISGDDVIKRIGPYGVSMALLGAAAELGALPYGRDEIGKAVERRLPEMLAGAAGAGDEAAQAAARNAIETNIAALAYGAGVIRGGERP
jgi:indolepyruvate ferredoxin oxidoreductase beta subunit